MKKIAINRRLGCAIHSYAQAVQLVQVTVAGRTQRPGPPGAVSSPARIVYEIPLCAACAGLPVVALRAIAVIPQYFVGDWVYKRKD